MPDPHFLTTAIHHDGREPLVLTVRDAAVPVATDVELAVDSAARNRGLLGRDALAQRAALVIAPSSAVHTFGMRFPIDVVFVARDGRVVKIRRAVPARRIAVAFRGFAVIELAAGTADRAGLKVGDQLDLRPA